MRKITIGCLGIAVLLGGVTYIAKQKVIALEENLAQINRQILMKKESEHLLKAELGHLSRPSRIQELAESHLDMKPIEGWQVVSMKNIISEDSALPQKGKGPIRYASVRPQKKSR